MIGDSLARFIARYAPNSAQSPLEMEIHWPHCACPLNHANDNGVMSVHVGDWRHVDATGWWK